MTVPDTFIWNSWNLRSVDMMYSAWSEAVSVKLKHKYVLVWIKIPVDTFTRYNKMYIDIIKMRSLLDLACEKRLFRNFDSILNFGNKCDSIWNLRIIISKIQNNNCENTKSLFTIYAENKKHLLRYRNLHYFEITK